MTCLHIHLKHWLMLLVILATAPLARGGEVELKILIPQDVYADYQAFIVGKDVLSLTDYRGKGSRRDVVEVVLLQQALSLGGIDTPISFSVIDSYKRILAEIRTGRGLMTANSSWLIDLAEMQESTYISRAIIADGDFEAGLYTLPTNQQALSASTLADIQQLSAVSSRGWQIDWKTLESLNLVRLENTVTWLSMVKMVNAGRADFLLAPFQPTEDLSLMVGGIKFLPIPLLKVGLKGSRHFAVSKHYPNSDSLFEGLNDGLKLMEARGVIRKAYLQSGFFNSKVSHWKNLTQTQ